jgi:hypothetical protein
MNVLDENIPDSQRQLLRSWRIRVHQIGHEIGRLGMKDDEIIPLLHELPPVTFFTRDLGFYHRRLCHDGYCLVCLATGQYEVASFVRRFLRHSLFNTRAKRMGKVIWVSHAGVRVWQLHAENEKAVDWH